MTFPVCALCSNTLGSQGQDLVAQLKLRLKVMLHEARHPELLKKVLHSAHKQNTGAASSARDADCCYDSDSSSSSECGDVNVDNDDDCASQASELTAVTAAHHKQHVSAAAATSSNTATTAVAAAATAVAVAAPLQRQTLCTQDQFRAGGGAGMQRAPQRKPSAGGGPVFANGFANGFQRTEQATSLPAQPALSLTRQLRVCSVFAGGEQCITTCPLAHPGVRDAAVVRSAVVQPRQQQQQQQQQQQRRVRAVDSSGSSSSSAQCVIVCEAALLGMLGQGPGCSEGMSCRQYHPYVRPSTQQLIDKIYQK
jgi:hypothetical protein